MKRGHFKIHSTTEYSLINISKDSYLDDNTEILVSGYIRKNSNIAFEKYDIICEYIGTNAKEVTTSKWTEVAGLVVLLNIIGAILIVLGILGVVLGIMYMKLDYIDSYWTIFGGLMEIYFVHLCRQLYLTNKTQKHITKSVLLYAFLFIWSFVGIFNGKNSINIMNEIKLIWCYFNVFLLLFLLCQLNACLFFIIN